MTKVIYIACLGSTLYMTGLIWFVAVVHYPLYDRVGPESFRAYQAYHMNATTWVVAPAMLLELVTTLLLVVRTPDGVHPAWVCAGLATVAVNWLSTGLIQVPLHQKLSEGFEPDIYQRLVTTNWVRVVAWTAHALLLLITLEQAIGIRPTTPPEA